jgi:hypothetical protein
MTRIDLPWQVRVQPVGADILAALADPEGCRVALLAWAEEAGWPETRYLVGVIPGGEARWREALQLLPPIQLAYLWAAIGLADEAQRAGDAPVAQRPRGEPAMPVSKTLEWRESTFTDIEPGMYLAEITDVSEAENQFEPEVERLQIQLVLLNEDGDRTSKEIRAYCNAKWGPKTTLYRWANQVLGKRCPGPGQPFDPNTLIGRRCAVLIEERETPNGPRPRVSELYHQGMLQD